VIIVGIVDVAMMVDGFLEALGQAVVSSGNATTVPARLTSRES
jgi:hypothetical protein